MCRALPCGLNKMQNLSHRVCVVHWTVHLESIRTVRWSPVGVRSESIGLSADFHQTVAAVWVQVHLESIRSPSGQSGGLTFHTGQAPDKHRKVTGKFLHWYTRKISSLDTQSPTESGRSPAGKRGGV